MEKTTRVKLSPQLRPAHEAAAHPPPLPAINRDSHSRSPIDVSKVITIHFVIPDKGEDMVDAHTHGLESYGHKEFQVLVPGFCSNDASLVLHDHADRVINQGERFKHGDFGQVDVVMCGYIEVPGDLPGEPTRLRIVHLSGELYPDWPDELSRPPRESSQDAGAGDRESGSGEEVGGAPSPSCEEARRARRRASR